MGTEKLFLKVIAKIIFTALCVIGFIRFLFM